MSAVDLHLASFSQLRGVGRRNRQPVLIEEQAVSLPSIEYDVLKELAASEWASLKAVDRAIKKATQQRYLAKYKYFLDDYIDKAETYSNTILFYGLVWAADTGDFDYAIKLADVIVSTGQRFELGFKRDAITICCDEIMLTQEKVFDAKKELTPEFSAVFERIKAKRWQPDNVITTGKFYRMAGRDEREKGNTKQAYDYFCEADAINPRAGVKKLIEEMAAKL